MVVFLLEIWGCRMCIIAVYMKNSHMTEKEIITMWESNPDGAGYAFFDKNKNSWVVKKGIMNLSELLSELKDLNYLNNVVNTTVVIHFRAATHGGIKKYLTHPFKIDLSDTFLYMFHNGVFSINSSEISLNKTYSYGNRYFGLYSNIYDFYNDNKCDLLFYEEKQNLEEDVEDYLDPKNFKVHSDTSFVCKSISQLNLTKEQFLNFINNPIFKEILSYSRLCLCFDGDENPVLIGRWEKEENKFFSNSNYKNNRLTHFYENIKVDNKETEEDKYDVFLVQVGKTVFTIDEKKKIATIEYYNPKELYSLDGELYMDQKGRLKLICDTEVYKVTFSENLEKKTKKKDKKNQKEKYAISDDGCLYLVKRGKKGEYILDEVKNFVKYPDITYFYDSREDELVKLKLERMEKKFVNEIITM